MQINASWAWLLLSMIIMLNYDGISTIMVQVMHCIITKYYKLETSMWFVINKLFIVICNLKCIPCIVTMVTYKIFRAFPMMLKRRQAKQSSECIPSSRTISKDCCIKALDYTRNGRGYILVHVLNNYEQDHNMKMWLCGSTRACD